MTEFTSNQGTKHLQSISATQQIIHNDRLLLKVYMHLPVSQCPWAPHLRGCAGTRAPEPGGYQQPHQQHWVLQAADGGFGIARARAIGNGPFTHTSALCQIQQTPIPSCHFNLADFHLPLFKARLWGKCFPRELAISLMVLFWQELEPRTFCQGWAAWDLLWIYQVSFKI